MVAGKKQLLIWLYGLVFAYELSDCGFEFPCSRLYYKYSACF